MKKLMALTVLASSSMMHVPMSVAQVTDQTFGGCIASLVESGLDRGKASQACFDTMSKQPQTQTLGQCVTDLKEQLGTPVTRACLQTHNQRRMAPIMSIAR